MGLGNRPLKSNSQSPTIGRNSFLKVFQPSPQSLQLCIIPNSLLAVRYER